VATEGGDTILGFKVIPYSIDARMQGTENVRTKDHQSLPLAAIDENVLA